MAEKYLGNYLGYIVSNNDPLKSGRVQVFVPRVNNYLFEKWFDNSEDATRLDRFFSHNGENLASDIDKDLLNRIREELPWARVAQPIMGASSSVVANQDLVSVSDGSYEFEERGSVQNDRGNSTFDSSESQKLNNDFINDETNQNNNNDYFVPTYKSTAFRESGVYRSQSDPYAVGAISSGRGDFGGKSYGTYQLSSTQGSLEQFVNSSSNPFRNEFQGLQVGSQEFDNKWREVSQRDNARFGQAQESFQEREIWGPQLRQFETNSGIDLSTKDDRFQDIVVGSINQYGSIASTSQANYLRSQGGQSLSSNEAGRLLQDYKLSNVDRNFRSSSPAIRQGVRNRIRQERQLFEGEGTDAQIAQAPQDSTISDNRSFSEEDQITPSDALFPQEDDELYADNSINSTSKPNENDHKGTKSAGSFEYQNDAFVEHVNNLNVNPLGHLYGHSNYLNTARGSFSLPSVGAHVWVFFEGGEIEHPVIFGAHFSQEDYKFVYDAVGEEGESPDYPPATDDEFQTGNVRNEDEDQIYRGKTAFNFRGGSLDFVDTTNRERVKLTHRKGSHYEMNQFGLNEFVVGNDQKNVKGHRFDTIWGNSNQHIDRDEDKIVYGNSYEKIGNIKEWKKHYESIKEILSPIHDKKRTFEIKRAEFVNENEQSSEQEQSGEFVDCPVCNQEKEFFFMNSVIDNILQPAIAIPCTPLGCDILVDAEDEYDVAEKEPETCLTCGGDGKSPSTQDGEWDVETVKEDIIAEINGSIDAIAQEEAQISNKTKTDGGNKIENVANDKFSLVGLEFNDFQSYRKDNKGKLVPYGLDICEEGLGTFPFYRASPLIEPVHVDKIPGGDFTQIASNRYNLLVGANGINIKTKGSYNSYAPITNITSDQLNIGSKNEVSIDGGQRLDLTADIISIRPRPIEDLEREKTYQNLLVDANIQGTKNLTIRGGAHIEGELTLHHVTAPLEYQETEEEVHSGYIIDGVQIGEIDLEGITIAVYGVCQGTVQVNNEPHKHKFPNLPLRLVDNYEDVRKVASKLNENLPIPPNGRENGNAKDSEDPEIEVEEDPYINENGVNSGATDLNNKIHRDLDANFT